MIERDKQSARSLEQPTPAELENVQAAAERRRFLKGLGIGLPAVMTLRSGALMAATSSQCLVNRTPAANFLPPTAPAFNAPNDNWLRGGADYGLYTDANNTPAVKVGSNYYDPSTGSDITSSLVSPVSSTGTNYRALCYVDQTGTIIYCDPTNPSYGPNGGRLGVNGSCATSFLIQP